MESGIQKVYWQKDPPAPGAQAVPAGHVQMSAKEESLQVAPAPPHVVLIFVFSSDNGDNITWARVYPTMKRTTKQFLAWIMMIRKDITV